MLNLYDIAYGAGLIASSPIWLSRRSTRHKVLGALRERMGREPIRQGDRPAVMIHAVSLGEMNATRTLVDQLRQLAPDLDFIVSTTTRTGYDRAMQLYGSAADVQVIHYPLDFSLAVRRVFDRLRPCAVVLLELELWPNFLHHCRQMKIPVVLINGRMTPGSFRNLSRFNWLARKMLSALKSICVQDADYARQFVTLGADPSIVQVTGTMKFDTAQVGRPIDGADALAQAVGIEPGEAVWVCGSTGPGEEALLLDAYDRVLKQFPRLRLVVVPRKPERFDEVADLIRQRGFGLCRRSQPGQVPSSAAPSAARPTVVLGDTMGELRTFYALATVVFVGRSLVDLGHRQHGSDMIEPAALAKPIMTGPFTTNFADAMRWLRASSAVREVATVDQLVDQVEQLLAGPVQAQAMADRARQVVVDQQGATRRHADVIVNALNAI